MASDVTVHMIVKNEENWVWFAIQSVLPWVKKIIIYDTGSTDATVDIIRTIESEKIVFEKRGQVTPKTLVDLRNEQIANTATRWFLLVDGDEIWTNKSSTELQTLLHKPSQNLSAVVTPTIVPVGDIYHRMAESTGKYQLLDKVGNFNIRAYRRRNGYSWEGIYPFESYADTLGKPVQQKPEELSLMQNPYWHMTHMRRSQLDMHRKRKLEIGKPNMVDVPEIFLITRPSIVPSPWQYFNTHEQMTALVLTPLLKLKRLLVGNKKAL